MSSTLICLVSNQYGADPAIFGVPWIPTPRSKGRDAHPRRSFPNRVGPPPAQARFPRYCGPSGRRAKRSLSTLLTETLQLDSSYEATTPARLDLVMRQRARRGSTRVESTPCHNFHRFHGNADLYGFDEATIKRVKNGLIFRWS